MITRANPPNAFKVKKSLGQNFLMHARIAERIALTAGLTKDDIAFEIGPGTGMLTKELLKLSKRVVALEADRELFEQLQEKFAEEIADKRLELICGDVRKFDPATLPPGYTLVANIPYYLTGEIFRMFLETKNQPKSMTLLVQKEVAERIVVRTKKPLDSARGKQSILALSVRAYGVPKYEFTVPRGAFVPAPNVDSAVLSVRNISRTSFASKKKEKLFFDLLHAGFAHKRKFVCNNLKDAKLPSGNITEKARAEDLELKDWLALLGAQGS